MVFVCFVVHGSNRIVTPYSYGAAGNSPTDLTGITYTDGGVTPRASFMG